MEITGKLIQLMPLQTGEGKNGTWKKQEIILETETQYPKKVCISIWGDKINEKQLVVGNKLTVSFDIESREYNGRWYTDVKAWKVDGSSSNSNNNSSNSSSEEVPNFPSVSENDLPSYEMKDDLPF